MRGICEEGGLEQEGQSQLDRWNARLRTFQQETVEASTKASPRVEVFQRIVHVHSQGSLETLFNKILRIGFFKNCCSLIFAAVDCRTP